MGAPSKGKRKEKANTCQNNTERGDSIRWITKRQCSFGDSCAFKHDPNKKGKRKPRSPIPTGSPHRNSKGDGKGGDGGNVKGTPTFTGKSLSGKANRPLCTNFKQGSCQKESSCNYWLVPECTRFKAVDADSERNAFANTAKPAAERNNSASIAIHIPSNEERQMQIRKNQSDDKTQYRVRLHHLANRDVKKKKKRKTETYTWSYPHWISKSTDSKRFKIRRKIYRMDSEHGTKKKKAAGIFHQNMHTGPGSYSEKRQEVPRTESRANVASPLMKTWKERETEFMVASTASLHVISNSDLTQKNRNLF